ncbi:tetra-peptide repeat homeobox protein 1-like [Macrobrachium rosenbergii]|uniref:tetra-peptide repeat homeobox protein 1-like n=1 Tax=Macrobrachium rosenbergii TaxID=79674 RepID=UPI0034D6306B
MYSAPPPRSIPDPIPVPGPASVPVPGPQSDLPPGDANSLPMPLACIEQCQAPSVLTDEHKKPLIVPDPALVPVPEHAPNLHSRGPTQDPLSSPSLAPLPAPVRETVPLDHSGSSPKGAASQPMPELVIDTCEPLTPPCDCLLSVSVHRRHNCESGFCHLSLGQ